MNIVSCFSGRYKEIFFFNTGGSKLNEFLHQPGDSFCLVHGRLVPVESLADAGPLVSDGHELYRISTGTPEIILLWNVQTRDSCACAVRVTLLCSINDTQRFIDHWKDRLQSLKEIDQTAVANEEISRLKDRVINDVGQYSYEELVSANALPDSWWREQFNGGSLTAMGLAIQSLSVTYSAPSEEVKKELEMLAKSKEVALRKAEIEAENERNQAILTARLKAEKEKIESDRILSETERRAELAKVELKADQEKAQILQATELQRMRYEKERLQLESDLAEIRNRPAEMAAIQEEQKRSQERFDQFSSEMATTLQTMTRALETITEMLNKKSASIPELSLHMFYNMAGISDSTLFLLGHLESKEFYSRFFAAQKERTGQGIDLALVKAVTRDVSSGQQNMKLDTLRIEESLEVTFCSPISGYATVINLGTSGRFWLQVPNAYVTPDRALVKAWERTSLPGPLLPAERLARNGLDYYEGGPTGWEEVIILVTRQPMNRFLSSTFPLSLEKSPFVEITPGTMKQLMKELSQMPEEDWTAGTLGFSVIQ